MIAIFLSVVTPADLIVILCSILGIYFPYFLQQWEKLHNRGGLLIISAMFLVSILGGVGVSLITRQVFSVIFARIFGLVGTSHLILLVSKMEMYRRLEMKRLSLEKEIEQMEQHVEQGKKASS